ncbi:MAG: hypothetical protein IKZ05_00190 [Clostridia bacterium]|nr:hypothetical protein [Clostridia bacterium]
MKKLIALLMAALMLVSFAACGEAKDKEFTKEGLTITLTDAFKEASFEGYTVVYDSANVAVFVIKESFSLLAGFEDYTINQYAQLVHTANSSKLPGEVKLEDGLLCFEYTYLNTDDNTTYKYFTTVFKGNDAFWTIQFCSTADKYNECKPEMIKYAKSVNVG